MVTFIMYVNYIHAIKMYYIYMALNERETTSNIKKLQWGIDSGFCHQTIPYGKIPSIFVRVKNVISLDTTSRLWLNTRI